MLAFVRLPCPNQPDDYAARGIGDCKKPPFNLAEGKPPLLTVIAAGVPSVRSRNTPYRVPKRYAVFSDILRGLAVVRFEAHP